MRYTEDGRPKCDVKGCGKPATANYQDAFIRWGIDEKGEYCSKAEMAIESAGDETNTHVCDKHDTPEHYA